MLSIFDFRDDNSGQDMMAALLNAADRGVKVTDPDITKFWLFMNKNYGVQEMDDILLNINGIHYLGSLRPGDTLYLIDYNDIEKFNEQKLGDSEDF